MPDYQILYLQYLKKGMAPSTGRGLPFAVFTILDLGTLDFPNIFKPPHRTVTVHPVLIYPVGAHPDGLVHHILSGLALPATSTVTGTLFSLVAGSIVCALYKILHVLCSAGLSWGGQDGRAGWSTGCGRLML